MSLPIVRARRKNVPSSQRSPCSMTCGHSRTQSSKPSVVMSQACWSSATSHSSLTSRSSEATRAKSSSSVSSPGTISSTVGGDAAQHPGLGPAEHRRLELVDVAHRQPERGRDLAQRRAPAGPQLAVLPVPEELVGVPRRARPGEQRGLAVLDHEHGVAGLVAAEVRVRGVRPEPVVGVVRADLVGARGQHQPLAGEHAGERRAAPGRGLGDRVPRQVELAVAPAGRA